MATFRAQIVTEQPDQQRSTKEQVLERLFNEHGAALRAFLRMRMGVPQEADDVVQEVFTRLARLENLLQRLPADGKGNRAYIFTVANNLIVDMERRKTLQRRYAEAQKAELDGKPQEDLATPESLVLANEDIARLREVIKQLKPVWRDAFIFMRVDLMTYREAAQRMGVTVKQVERYLTSALIHIRKAAIGGVERDK